MTIHYKSRLPLLLVIISPCFSVLNAEVATIAEHPYLDPQKERENFVHADEKVNEARVYDFYQRQADYYMARQKSELPKLIPAYPGLDAGEYGHWGKNHQNHHQDPRWNSVKIGSMHTHVTIGDPEMVGKVVKGANVKLADGLAACFDLDSLSYRAVWKGWINFTPFRWGTARGASINGEISYSQKKPEAVQNGTYLGMFRHGEQVIFHYRIGNVEILDSPSSLNGEFVRTIEVISEGGKASLPDLSGPPPVYGNLRQFTKGAKASWTETVTTELKLGEPMNNSAYAIDTFQLPFENPYASVMQLSGIAFGSDETIYVSTLVGEIWTVQESPSDPKKLIWKRFASGLHSPFGLHYDEDGLFCLDRGQIYRFHDFNEDGEADYYECYAGDFRDEGRSHTHTFGLHRTQDGSFYFTQKEQIMRTSPERVTTEIGYGIRNGMGIGGSSDYFWIGPQEGNWTPASTIIEVEEGKHYGVPKTSDPKPISAPICFIPRAIDNSTGGFVEITSDRWGPFQGSHVGLSFGANTQYLILRDAQGPKPQGATIPLEGEFLSGVVRGAFRKSDGQLYVVGLDGWGDYSIQDGCLQRVRYTGGEVYKPTSFQVFENGIRVDFPVALDADTLSDTSHFFAQTWEYVFSKGYGSPEYSSKSDEVGHDVLQVRSVQPIAGENAIFVEMPKLEPTMILYLRMHLKTKTGKAFEADLFASPMYPQPHYHFDGAAPPVEGKPKEMIVRVKEAGSTPKDKRVKTKVIEGARELVVNAVSGLKFDTTLLEVKRNEPIALKFTNKDIMPHNLVIVDSQATAKVGEASFKMLNDPKAAELNYTPKMREVRYVVPVIDPEEEVTIYFKAPRKKGDYPFICTFPGHWQVMQGILRVE